MNYNYYKIIDEIIEKNWESVCIKIIRSNKSYLWIILTIK